MITGASPLVLRRTHYFEDLLFIDCFSPHPDHTFQPAIPNIVEGIRPFIDRLEAVMNGGRLTISKWFITAGDLTAPSQAAAKIDRVPPDNRTVFIQVPCSGKVTATAATFQNKLSSGEYWIPQGPLFTVKNYHGQNAGVDPFRDLREACLALDRLRQLPRPIPRQLPAPMNYGRTGEMTPTMKLLLVGAILFVLYLVFHRMRFF
jgi:hypothetical protein